MAKPISDQQLDLNRSLHQSDPRFGTLQKATGVARGLPLAMLRMHQLGLASSLLDYGTGKGQLVETLRSELPDSIQVTGYDPAVDQWSAKPESPSDILTCLDVLEHVEVNSLDAILDDFKSLAKLFCYVAIDLQPAVKTLANGRNAHILLAPPQWWVSRFSQVFSCVTCFPVKHLSGIDQKIIIACTNDASNLPHIYSFLNKMNIYNMRMDGGLMNA